MTISPSKLGLWIAASALFAVPHFASAQTSSSLSGLYACEAIADKDNQLDCFLSETAKLRAANRAGEVVVMEKKSITAPPTYTSPAVDSQAVASVPKVAMPEPQVETKKEKKSKNKTPKKQTLIIKSAERYGAKRYVRFTMENGDVWEQTQPGRIRLDGGEKNSLTVKKASFGSFLARVNDTGSSFRVRKVK